MKGRLEEEKWIKTANENLITIFLSGMTLLFLLMVVSLKVISDYSFQEAGQSIQQGPPLLFLITFFISLDPPNGQRSSQRDPLLQASISSFSLTFATKSLQAIESAADVNLLMIDKTGTLTLGNREAVEFIPAPGISLEDFATIARLASLSDETPKAAPSSFWRSSFWKHLPKKSEPWSLSPLIQRNARVASTFSMQKKR